MPSTKSHSRRQTYVPLNNFVRNIPRHCQIIHLPTFQAEHASLPLLAATFLGGSLHSYPGVTYFLAIDCLDIAEAYLFSLPVFQIEYRHATQSETQVLEHGEVLKAVILLLQMQIGRNSHDIRQRVRYQLFPKLMHAARITSLFGVKQDDDSAGSKSRAWNT